MEEDYRCHQTSIPRANGHSNILKHASKVYTHKLYKLVENEYLDGTNACDVHEIEVNGSLFKYECMMHRKDMNLHIVCLDTSSLDVSCTCAKFVTLGILCCHALAILKQKKMYLKC